MLHCDVRLRWKIASDLRFRAAISEPKTPFLCGIPGDLAQSTRKSLAIAIVRFWCAEIRGFPDKNGKPVGTSPGLPSTPNLRNTKYMFERKYQERKYQERKKAHIENDATLCRTEKQARSRNWPKIVVECFRGPHREGRNFTSFVRFSGPFFSWGKMSLFYLKTCTP